MAEWFIVLVPLTLFGKTVFAAWVIDYILAFFVRYRLSIIHDQTHERINCQRGISGGRKSGHSFPHGLAGGHVWMDEWMAIVIFVLIGHEMEKTNPVFWVMRVIAMLTGFLTSYPVNWWLIKKGIKEKM